MTKAATATSWAARWRRWRRPPTDWADLGTAFGLEMSLRPAAVQNPAAAAPPHVPERRWWQRLARRASATLR